MKSMISKFGAASWEEVSNLTFKFREHKVSICYSYRRGGGGMQGVSFISAKLMTQINTDTTISKLPNYPPLLRIVLGVRLLSISKLIQ